LSADSASRSARLALVSTHRRVTIDSDVKPGFTACYLRIAGSECAFIETHTSHAVPKLLAALKAEGKQPEDVRWIVITHAHLDHASGAGSLMAACPKATLLAHPRAARHMVSPQKLIDGAKAVYGEARFAELYGTIQPIAAERVRALEDGESFDLADAKLTVWHTAGHANHHFVVDDPKIETVYTGDTFGLVYPSLQRYGRFALPSTSPVNFDAAAARTSLDKVLSLKERFACLTHYDGYEDSAAIAAQVRRFVDLAGTWVDEAARGDETLEAMTARMARLWTEAIQREAPRFGPEEMDWLALDIDLNAQGLAFVANAKRAAASGSGGRAS
jgi:glyoxylase-like metal-dependent hydrolase (beta-lactamase superfamily II)